MQKYTKDNIVFTANSVQNHIFLWRISRRIVVPRETMGKKTKLFVTGNGTKLLSSTTLQSGFFHWRHFSLAKSREIDLESYSLHCRHPFPSWRDKSLNNDQGRSSILQWEAERCKSQGATITGKSHITQVGTEESQGGRRRRSLITDLLIHFRGVANSQLLL